MSSASTMADVLEVKKKGFLVQKRHELHYSNKHDGEKKRKNHVFVYAISIALFGLAIYARFFAKNDENQLHNLEWPESKVKIDKGWIDVAKEKVTSLSLINAVLFGLTMTTFTWMVTFFDSLLPGKCPPSPLSPGKLRQQSGHTFHSGYVLAMINGCTCVLMLYWM